MLDSECVVIGLAQAWPLTTLAVASVAAVEDVLDGELYGGPGSRALDAPAVRQAGGRRHGPA